MPLNDQGYALLELPEVDQKILDSYEDCPHDEFMGNGTRYKRFSQYKLSPVREDWEFEILPHRDYTAFKRFNAVGGGIRRPYEPIQVDFTPLIRLGALGFPLDRSESWQINVHQNRTQASPEKPGVLTPEGVHQDGHEYVMIAVLRRHSVSGGETRLWRPGAESPFWTGTLEPGQAVLLDDRAISHDVTDVQPLDGRPGYRDILIVAFSRWKDKWYGEEHEAAVLSEAAGSSAAM